MKEGKIDRLIRNTMNDGFIQNPSHQFTEQIMEKLGIVTHETKLKTKPIKSRWGLWSIVIIYLILMATILIIPGKMNSDLFQLPKFELPSLDKYFSFSGTLSKLLLTLIFGGWFLIFIDNFIKKYIIR